MTNPLFSIVTVTLNNVNGLKKTHKSIINQNFYNYEWIVIDGGSRDATTNFLKGTHANYTSKKDKGIYDAMNKGIERARGDYLIFMNAGDCFASSDILEQIQKTVERETPDFIYGDAYEKLNGTNVIKKSLSHQKIEHGMFTHHQSMIYKKSIIGALRYNLEYSIAADYDFTYWFLEKSRSTSYLPHPICLFEAGGVSQKNALKGRIEQFKIRKNLQISIFKNSSIFIAQTGLFTLRNISPKFYWWLKRSLTSA